MALKIGVISDTHGILRPEIAERLDGCDYILHAGDLDRRDILSELEEIAPVCAVRGNNDWGAWAGKLPRTKTVTLGGVKFFLVHNRDDVPPGLGDVGVVIFGHTHRYYEERARGRLWLNPGSCALPRYGRDLTMALVTVEDGAVQVEKVAIPRPR